MASADKSFLCDCQGASLTIYELKFLYYPSCTLPIHCYEVYLSINIWKPEPLYFRKCLCVEVKPFKETTKVRSHRWNLIPVQ